MQLYREGYLARLPKELKELAEGYRNSCSPWLKVIKISNAERVAWGRESTRTAEILLRVVEFVDGYWINQRMTLVISEDSIEDYLRALENLDSGATYSLIPEPPRVVSGKVALQRGGPDGLPGGRYYVDDPAHLSVTDVFLYCDELRDAILEAITSIL